ncbi:MAG: hypothetical protein WBM53_07925, partial [Maribacter sp.]
ASLASGSGSGVVSSLEQPMNKTNRKKDNNNLWDDIIALRIVKGKVMIFYHISFVTGLYNINRANMLTEPSQNQ